MIKTMTLTPALACLLLFVASVPGLAGGADGDVDVGVGNFYFDPDAVTIQTGETITWNWESGTHSVETESGSQEWCSTRSSGSCDRTFGFAGTFEYRCGVHPTTMQATLIVEGPVVIDLEAVSIDAETGIGTATIEATFQNNGPIDLEPVGAVVQYEYKGQWHTIAEFTLALEAGASESVTAEWEETTKIGEFPVRAVIDPEGDYEETSEGNNVAEGTAAITTDLVAGTDLLDP